MENKGKEKNHVFGVILAILLALALAAFVFVVMNY